ncbi:ATP-binding protein [Micromonospora sp. NBC_00389]|uniref:ATP-binding protein n=1 Tax=Micromonospora sp. NBC_00389 TaxID=2903586 RepID=UPI002E20F518
MSDDGGTPESVRPAREPRRPITVLMSQHFTATTVTALRHAVEGKVAAAGLVGDPGFDFVLAVHELVTNAVRHGGGRGHLDLRREEDVLLCEISDQGAPADNLPVRLPAVDAAGGRGLWLARQLTDGLILTRRPDGLTATITVCLEPLSGTEIWSASGATHSDGPIRPGEAPE